jgi:hypothetical protein
MTTALYGRLVEKRSRYASKKRIPRFPANGYCERRKKNKGFVCLLYLRSDI